jgi:uncharacterized membrane protein YozB (DUF420 family)
MRIVERRTKADLLVPWLLVALSIVPSLGGLVRLARLLGEAPVSADDVRFAAAPTPIIVHVVCATTYSLLGAFQFSPALRLRWPRLHRRAGRVLALSGLAAGITGLVMTVRYAIPVSQQGPLLYAVRVVVAASMMAAILIGWWSIVRRQVARHEAWMIRAYALGQGAGTQVLVLLPWMLASNASGGPTRDVLMTLAWVINAVVAEAIIRMRGRRAR